MHRTWVVLLAGLASSAAAGAQETLLVHLTPGTARQVTKEEDHQLEAAFRASQKACDDLEAAIKKQYGKKEEAWPDAKKEEMRLARDASAQAQTDWFYSGIKQKDIDDSIHDVTEKLAEKKTVRLVPTAAEADLEIVVIGRGKVIRDLGWGGAEAAAEVALRVAPGGRVDAAALGRSAGFRAKKSLLSNAGVFTIHDYSADAPYWMLIARKPSVMYSWPWKGAAGQAADALERFAAENADKLAAARNAAQAAK